MAFLGNYGTLASAQAAAAVDGRQNTSYFVTGDSQLYVVAGAGTVGVAVSTDTIITLTGVTALVEADMQLGSQGAGNAISLAAATVPVVNTTASNATSSKLTTGKDDTITSAASTALVGTAAALTGGLGNDTLNATVATQALLTTLAASSGTGVLLSGIETANITVTTPASALLITTGIPTDLTALTVSAGNGNGTLTATTTAGGQTITVVNTVGTTASTITATNVANTTIVTGAAADGVTVAGGAASTGISVNTGAGADTITIGASTALSGLGNVLNGGSNLTGAVDTLTFYALGATENVNFATLITAGDIKGIEAASFVNADDSAHAITAGTGITRYTTDTSTGAEVFTITATAAQAAAITSLIDTTGSGSTKLVIAAGTGETSGTVDYSGDTTTNLTDINWEALPVALTLNNTANTVVQGAAVAGTGAQTITMGSGAAIQSATINSTGDATFNVTAAALAVVAVADVDSTISAAEALQSFIGVAGATAVVNVTGAGGNFTLLDATPSDGDDDLVFTNIDTVNVNTTTASIIVVQNENDAIDFTLNLGAFAGHEVQLDTIGTAVTAVTITGFAAGASGDKILMNEATTITATDVTTFVNASTTGGTLPGTGTNATTVTSLYIGSSTASQIVGALTSVGDAGPVEASIIAAAMNITGANIADEFFYYAADNGTATGIYRVVTASANMADLIPNASNEMAVTLIATLDVADSSTLVAANFAT